MQPRGQTGKRRTPRLAPIAALGMFIFAASIFPGFPLDRDSGQAVICVSHGAHLATDGDQRTRCCRGILPVIASDSIPALAAISPGWRAVADEREHRLTWLNFPPSFPSRLN